MTTRRRHLTLIPGDAPHVLLLETYDNGYADAVCTYGDQWNSVPIELLEGLAEWHQGALIA